MNDDDCIKWVLPAISLGFAVQNDPQSKLMFWNDDIKISFIEGAWIADNGIDYIQGYTSLHDALVIESERLNMVV